MKTVPTPVPAPPPHPSAPVLPGVPTPTGRANWVPIVITLGILFLVFIALGAWVLHASREDRKWFEAVKDDPMLLQMTGAPASLGRPARPAVYGGTPDTVPLHISAYRVRGPKGKGTINFYKVDLAGERLVHRIELAPDDGGPRTTLLFTDALADRGWEYADTGDLDKAFAAFDLALQLNPRDAWAYNNRALTYASAGKLESALEDFAEALRLEPGEQAIYVSRGQVLALDRNDRGAIQDFEQAIALAPWDPDAYCLLAVLSDVVGLRGQAALARDRLEVARQVYGIRAEDIAEAEQLGRDFRDSLAGPGDEE